MLQIWVQLQKNQEFGETFKVILKTFEMWHLVFRSVAIDFSQKTAAVTCGI